MKVNSNRDISFKSVYTNKVVKKGLELAADNGSLFAATAIVGFSAIRPISIWLTPKTEKEDRLLAISKSIISSTIGFLLMLGISLPVAKGIKKIDKNPEKFLKKESVNKYRNGLNDIYNSKSYTLATQSFKLGLGAITAIPKAMLVAAGVPMLNKALKGNEKKETNNNINFKGKSGGNVSEGIAKIIGKVLDKKSFQNFSEKYKDTNFPMHIVAGVDTLSTAAFCYETSKNNDIPPKRRQTLVNNTIIGTALSIACGYTVDKLLDKPTEKFISKYKEINKNEKNLKKQVQGIKIAKPILILGSIYYIVIPLISTFLADKTQRVNTKS